MHDHALPNPVKVPGLVDAVARIMVRTAELLTLYHRQALCPGVRGPEHRVVPLMALIAPFAPVTRSMNRSTPYHGDHRMPTIEGYRVRSVSDPVHDPVRFQGRAAGRR